MYWCYGLYYKTNYKKGRLVSHEEGLGCWNNGKPLGTQDCSVGENMLMLQSHFWSRGTRESPWITSKILARRQHIFAASLEPLLQWTVRELSGFAMQLDNHMASCHRVWLDHFVFCFFRFWKRIFNIWSIKYRLIIKLITDLVCKLRDESNKPN